MKIKSIIKTLLLALVVLAVIGFAYLFYTTSKPKITLSKEIGNIISTSLPITITATDEKNTVKQISVEVTSNNITKKIIDIKYLGSSKTEQATFTLKDSGFTEGEVNIRITANSSSVLNFGKSEVLDIKTTIDNIPPKISLLTSRPNIQKGGSSVIVYSLNKDAAQTGVLVNELFFPGFKQDNGNYICYFAFPYYIDIQDYQPQVVAIDVAGNTKVDSLSVYKKNKVFKHDVINITERLLDAKKDEFSNMAKHTNVPIEQFLYVNKEVRKQNAATLIEIGKNTAAEALWDGAFITLPRGAVRAGFGDKRTYLWDNKEVDEQVHLGYDLASIAQAPVPSSNSGIVVFAEYLGIYGNVVVIDHGLGLQSLYSHLTTIAVEPGQNIKKGETIGTTGTTGMAVGDHLHFGILLHGLEVSPTEWLDASWINNNIISRVLEAGGTAPKLIEQDKKTAPAKPNKKSNKRRR